MKNSNYLIIGGGRLASHIKHYFSLMGISFSSWKRNDGAKLCPGMTAGKVLLAINDDSLQPFIAKYKSAFGENTILIHFSGSLSLRLAEGVHPLMTFGDQLYNLSTYKRIPMITEQGRISFKKLFPELPNPSIEIKAVDKPLYHAWCTIGGNFSTILIRNYLRHMKSLGIPETSAMPFIEQTIKNIKNTDSPLTGPLSRRDVGTIQKHLYALEDDKTFQIYKSFLAYSGIALPEEGEE